MRGYVWIVVVVGLILMALGWFLENAERFPWVLNKVAPKYRSKIALAVSLNLGSLPHYHFGQLGFGTIQCPALQTSRGTSPQVNESYRFCNYNRYYGTPNKLAPAAF